MQPVRPPAGSLESGFCTVSAVARSLTARCDSGSIWSRRSNLHRASRRSGKAPTWPSSRTLRVSRADWAQLAHSATQQPSVPGGHHRRGHAGSRRVNAARLQREVSWMWLTGPEHVSLPSRSAESTGRRGCPMLHGRGRLGRPPIRPRPDETPSGDLRGPSNHRGPGRARSILTAVIRGLAER